MLYGQSATLTKEEELSKSRTSDKAWKVSNPGMNTEKDFSREFELIF